MEHEATYRNITSAVRTPRFAVLVERNDLYWKAYMHGIIQSFAQIWGGEHFIIIPTDGKIIDDKFWEILEAYSPDKIGRYIPSLLDMQEAQPEAYAKVKEHYRQTWGLDDEKFKKTWAEQTKSRSIGGLEVSKELSEELKNRLSPFYFQDHVVGENVFHGSPLGFPFTDLEHIVEAAKDRPTRVIVPKRLDNEDYQLLAMSRTGALSADYLEKLKDKGFTEVNLPDKSPSFRDKDYILALEKDEYDTRWEKALKEAVGGEQPDDSFVRYLPFKLSMLHLGKFYRRDTHREEKEDLLIVVGNTMDDFCLYYCLSRLHDGVYWFPEQYLRQANKKHEANKRRIDDEEVEKYTKHEDVAIALANEYFSIIRHDHDTKNIGITSASLTIGQLAHRRRWMGKLSYINPREYLSHITVVALEAVEVDCVMRVIEVNNHANQHDMIFQGGKGVGRFSTPKPKNFNSVNPAEHRWITTLEIDKYSPPLLPFLGGQIIGIRNMSYDTRVAKDGLAYLCPNVAYFGGDIDVNTVRPELTLLDEWEMFRQYFADAGFATELSDKGSYLRDTINRFGSLEQTAAFFRTEQKRLLFDQFLIKKKDQDSEVIYLDAESRAYLSFEAFKRRLSGEEEAVLVIEKLISKDILRRGFIFQCSRCRLAAWYDVALVGSEFICARCDLKQPYTQTNWKMPAEPRWYYKLAETVYQFYKSSSHLTALALDKLRQEAPDEFHYISETNIINPLNATNPKREIDILAIAKGNIILGECKDCPVAAADIRKYLTIFSELKIQPYQFLLATTEESVTPQVQTELEKFKRHRLFTRKELLDNPTP